MKKIFTIALFVMLNTCLYAQTPLTQTIRGTVTDALTEQPIIGVTVSLVNTNPLIGGVTDTDGEFALRDVAIGRYDITFSFVGYNAVTMRNIELVRGKEVVLSVKMEEKVLETQVVEVKAYSDKGKPVNEMAMISARSFSVEETERFAGSLGDPSRMVANYAGVMSSSDQRNDIVIRGNSPLGLLWRLEDIDIPNPNHFGAMGTTGGPVSMLNNNLLTNSDFYTGAFPAEYGNATAGAFDLQMRNGNNQKREYTFQMGFGGIEAGAEGYFTRKSKASYMINYRYSIPALANLLGNAGEMGNNIPIYQDLSFKINVPNTKAGKFVLLGILGKSLIQFRADTTSDAWSYGLGGTNTDFGARMGLLGFSHQYFFDSETRIKTTLSVQHSSSYTEIDSVDDNLKFLTEFYRSNLSENKLTGSVKFIKKFNTKNFFSTGIILEHFLPDFADSVRINQKFRTVTQADGSLTLLRGFVQWQHKFNDALSLYAGTHAILLQLNNTYNIDPRLSLKWKFNSQQSFSLGWGIHSQLQPHTVYFATTQNDDGSVSYTNKDLDLFKSMHVVGGYDVLLGEQFRLKSEIYYQSLYDIAVHYRIKEFAMVNTGDFFALPFIDSLENGGTGRNYGLELTLERFLNKGYYFLLTSSLFNSLYTGYDMVERNTAFNGNFVFNALGGYEIKISKKAKVMLDLRGVWAGGKRYIPVDLELSKQRNEQTFDWSHAYEHRYKDYIKLDARASFVLNGKRITQTWALDVMNVTNRKNVLAEVYNVRAKEIITENQAARTPMFLYRLQF